jgi:GT2 family glycosyltransferase
VREALRRSRDAEDPDHTIPLVITPMFHDGDVLPRMLASINVPVHEFFFIWNSNDENVGKVVRALENLPFGVHIVHDAENLGFSASINLGLRFGRRNMSHCPWFFIVNCDVAFPPVTLPSFTQAMNRQLDLSRLGMVYPMSDVDHYAFAVTRVAVEKAGLMDENFYPAYFEDIDWRWRMNLAGFEEHTCGLPVRHIRSINLKRADERFLAMHRRHANGWAYGFAKWGEAHWQKMHERFPPSGYRNPFGIKEMPLDLWVVDPDRIRCIKTGQGVRHAGTDKCWFAGEKTLKPHLPPTTVFPKYLKEPTHESFKPR